MTQEKIEIKIKSSTFKVVKKYLWVTLCCFIIAIIYPFINIYFGDVRYHFIGSKDFYLIPFLEGYKSEKTINDVYDIYYSDEFKSITYYTPRPYTGGIHHISEIYPNHYKMDDYLNKKTGIWTSIRIVFKIDDYKQIFNFIFYPLLILSIILMNFKFKLVKNIKDEENYKVLDCNEHIRYTGSYNDCVDWIESVNIGSPVEYTIQKNNIQMVER